MCMISKYDVTYNAVQHDWKHVFLAKFAGACFRARNHFLACRVQQAQENELHFF